MPKNSRQATRRRLTLTTKNSQPLSSKVGQSYSAQSSIPRAVNSCTKDPITRSNILQIHTTASYQPPNYPTRRTNSMSTRPAALSLRLALDWAVQRQLWRGQALYIRSLFEANRHVTDPRQQRALLSETEKLLSGWKHPDPYVPPTAPGGSKYERNLPSPVLELHYLGHYHWILEEYIVVESLNGCQM
ncbi:Complex 1 LYR protein [Cordyceps militaris CM01]|uniref:NADH dehydrogenase [ubiquinone] 1 beta subcomplex subunit 9 n=1 Tax=Cordyceps militaris (strain CM01) TaxID=983644 RepID=G3J3S4_CORMM|nr:Complex 1 LYR protein [Cordyceps militaris CM01]EGX96549.1 Complex 1 LYR protein [Cordyceps militaris CM01]